MSRRGLLSLLLLGLLGLSLASVGLPEGVGEPTPSLYDGDEDDAGLPASGRTDVYFQRADFGLVSIPILSPPDVGRLPLRPQTIRGSSPPPPQTRFIRAPPVR